MGHMGLNTFGERTTAQLIRNTVCRVVCKSERERPTRFSLGAGQSIHVDYYSQDEEHHQEEERHRRI